jgi:superfamily II DNA or RNA helicase
MTFAVGSLVRARHREWVVLPESDGEMLVLRPLGGTDQEVTGIYLPLEHVEPATFELPDPTKVGDARSCRLLRDAVRIGFRNSTGPFRSFGNIAVEPRPYQLVPLLMALKLDPVRLLIADDVGIGKTVEAMLVARELLDRGEVEQLSVLCPPALAEQWQTELREKCHLDAQLVLPSTVSRLERGCRFGESLFERYDCTVVSTDFIKQDRRREDFLRAAPRLLIVDEAHTCIGASGQGSSHQRHKLVSGLARDPERHLVLVTATPHSGNEEAFRSLLALLRPEFANLPDDLTGDAHVGDRRVIAQHFVQRRRADIRGYLDTETPFPDREATEASYRLMPEYKKLFERALSYAREAVQETSGESTHRQRVRWWSLLALLRSLASSPAAAAATLRSRASSADTDSAAEADEIGRRAVLDLTDDESAEGVDVIPGSDDSDESTVGNTNHRRLLEMARQAEALQGAGDAKLAQALKIVGKLVDDGYRPIVFCRFIPTAEYVAEQFAKKLRGVEVAAVTGTLPPVEREERIAGLVRDGAKRVLVCTDCLSEGVNLQDHFDAVVHYDLSWNPTRHEQREGRVDRFGQPSPTVRVVTYWGEDTQIDGIVLDVLIRKHEAIRSALGISVPVPIKGDAVIEAVFEGLLLREGATGVQERLEGFEELLADRKKDLDLEWDNVTEREKRSRTMFAQESIKVDEVAAELAAVREAIGSSTDVARFVGDALRLHGAVISGTKPMKIDLKAVPLGLKDALRTEGGGNGLADQFAARFELPTRDDEVYLSRTHPLVSGLASFVADAALDELGNGAASRCGAVRTRAVERRTVALLVRFRFKIVTKQTGKAPVEKLAEDCLVLAYVGAHESPDWLTTHATEDLLGAEPDANLSREEATEVVQRVFDAGDEQLPYLQELAQKRAAELLETHRRVRAAAAQRGVSYEVSPQGDPDLVGTYVYLPMPKMPGVTP